VQDLRRKQQSRAACPHLQEFSQQAIALKAKYNPKILDDILVNGSGRTMSLQKTKEVRCFTTSGAAETKNYHRS